MNFDKYEILTFGLILLCIILTVIYFYIRPKSTSLQFYVNAVFVLTIISYACLMAMMIYIYMRSVHAKRDMNDKLDKIGKAFNDANAHVNDVIKPQISQEEQIEMVTYRSRSPSPQIMMKKEEEENVFPEPEYSSTSSSEEEVEEEESESESEEEKDEEEVEKNKEVQELKDRLYMYSPGSV